MGKVEGNRRPSDWRMTVAEQRGDRKPRMSGESMAGAIAKIAELGRFGFWAVLDGFERFWKIPRALAFLRCRRFDSTPLLDERKQSRICLKVRSLPKKQQRFTNGTVWTHLGPNAYAPVCCTPTSPSLKLLWSLWASPKPLPSARNPHSF